MERKGVANSDRRQQSIRQRRYINALLKCLGNQSAACRMAGVSRTSVDRWKKRNPHFSKKIEQVIGMRYEDDFQFCYHMAMKEAKAGNWKAIRFMMEFLAPLPGCYPRPEAASAAVAVTARSTITLASDEYGLFTPELLKDERIVTKEGVTDDVVSDEETG